MAAVVAAIGAAFFAGAIALYREYRQEQRRLLISARVLHATFGVAAIAIKTSLNTNGWAPLNLLPGETSFSTAWESSKGDLAGHLTWPEWRVIETTVSRYSALTSMTQGKPPQDTEEVLGSVADALDKGRTLLKPYCTTRPSRGKRLWRRINSKKQEEASAQP